MAVLHAAWDALRAVAWVLTWCIYGVYVAVCIAMALIIAAGIVTTILAAIPGRAGPKPPA